MSDLGHGTVWFILKVHFNRFNLDFERRNKDIVKSVSISADGSRKSYILLGTEIHDSCPILKEARKYAQ